MQGGSSPAVNGMPNGNSEHGRKPSMVISAQGSSGYTQNGGPVGQAARAAINFGSMNAPEGAPQNAPYQAQNASLNAPQQGSRVIEPTHSPQPIPQPILASGGRPPSSLQSQNNGLNFGSMGADSSGQVCHTGVNINPYLLTSLQMQPGQQVPMHERRASSQSHGGDIGGNNMRLNFVPQGGRGRGYPQAPYGSSPGPGYRQLSTPRAPNMAQQFSQGSQNPPFPRGGRNSPALPPAQPHMGYGGYPPHLTTGQSMYNMPAGFDPYAGYNPYAQYNYQYPGQGPPQSPRPSYPNAYAGTPGNSQPPFMPPSMARTPSQASDRPPSSMSHVATPSQTHAQTASTPIQHQTPQASSNFIRPVKKSSAIKITNDKGEAVTFGKPSLSPSPAQQQQPQPQTPVIVSTPNASTPPPRAASSQHNRTESKPAMTAEETQNAFREQVKKQVEEEKRKREAEAAAKAKPEEPAQPAPEPAADNPACLLYTSPSPRDGLLSRMPSSA